MSTINTSQIVIYSNLDKENVPVPSELLKRFPTIVDMTEGCKLEEGGEDITLPVDFTVAQIKMVFALAKLAQDTPAKVEAKKTPPKNDVVDPAIRAKVNAAYPTAQKLLVDYDYQALEKLLLACSFFQEMEGLHITARVVAGHLEGKTTEELRAYMGVENDFTPEEEEDIKKNCRVVNFEKSEDK